MSTTDETIQKLGSDEPREILASRLIDAWCDSHGGQISWVKAVEIAAIITKQSDEERARMLAMNEDGDPLGIVQRLRNGGQPDLANMAERMQIALQELVERADLSDDSQYGTLSTKYVRATCKRGLDAAKGEAS
jgi:hypothetical protein